MHFSVKTPNLQSLQLLDIFDFQMKAEPIREHVLSATKYLSLNMKENYTAPEQSLNPQTSSSG